MNSKKDAYYECERGWDNLIDSYVEMIRRVEPKVQFLQIKEKFGELRIYCGSAKEDSNMDIVHIICDHAEMDSKRVCERCGHRDPGFGDNRTKLRTDRSWIKTLCDECVSKENA